MLTLALMLGSAGAVVAVGEHLDTLQKAQEPTVATAASGASAGENPDRQTAGAMIGG
jgi:GNAT superfamily N-acetyltransferase